MPDETGDSSTKRQPPRPWTRIAAIAARQERRVSLEQLRRTGLTRDQVVHVCRTGRLAHCARGVYALAPVGDTPRERAWTAYLALGPASFATCLTALSLRGIVAWDDGPVHMGARTQRRAPEGVIVHHLAGLPTRQVWKAGGLPATAPARSLLDSATVLAPEPLEIAVGDALADHKVSLAKLDEILATTRGHQGGPALAAALISIRDDPGRGRTHGDMEKLFRPMLAALPDLPPYVRNAHLELAPGEIVKPDVWFPTVRVWLELDSRRWHEQRRTMDADRRKDQRAVALGIAPFRLTWRHLVHEWPAVSHDLLATLAVRRDEGG